MEHTIVCGAGWGGGAGLRGSREDDQCVLSPDAGAGVEADADVDHLAVVGHDHLHGVTDAVHSVTEWPIQGDSDGVEVEMCTSKGGSVHSVTERSECQCFVCFG